MGTFEQIRRTSPYILALFALIFVGFMVISDMSPDQWANRGPDPRTSPIAVVNGKEILQINFEGEARRKAEQERMQREMMGDENADIDETRIRQALWQEFINNEILRQQAKKADVIVTDEQVLDQMFENPPAVIRQAFWNDSTKTFNKEAFVQTYPQIMKDPSAFINYMLENIKKNNPKITRDELEKQAKRYQALISEFYQAELNMPKQQRTMNLQTLVNTAGGFVSPSYAKLDYTDENSEASVKFFFFDINKIPDSTVQVSDNEIKEYYDAHKKYYDQKPARKIRYVVMPVVPSEKDSLNVEKRVAVISRDLENAKTKEGKDSVFTLKMEENNGQTEDFKLIKDLNKQLQPYLGGMEAGAVAGPIALPDGTYFIRLDSIRKGENEVVHAAHILFNTRDNPNRNQDSLKREAMKVLREAQKPNADFAALARMHSEGPTASKGGDLGYFGKGQMVKEFSDAAFAAKPGQVVGLVKTQFGYHIIKVYDKKSEEIKYSYIKLVPKVSDATRRRLRRLQMEFLTDINAGKDFNEIATSMNLQPQESPFFQKEQPILNSLFYSALAFKTEPGKIIDPSKTRDDDKFYVIQVAEARKAGVKPLDDVRDLIVAQLRVSKKLDLVKKQAEELYSKVKSYPSLSEAQPLAPNQFRVVQKVKNNGSVPGVGTDWVFTTMAFKLELNKISAPIRGERGYYIMQVTSRNVPKDNKKFETSVAEKLKMLKNTARTSAYNGWFRKVMEDSKIEDYRSDFYREY